MLVQQILKSKASDEVVTIRPDVTVADAIEVLAARRIGALIVSDNGRRAQGILSERDIVRELGRRGRDCLEASVDEMMTSKIVACQLEDKADTVLERMTEGRFRHMPVVDDDGHLVGLISIGDVVKARLAELAMERDALQGMVMGH